MRHNLNELNDEEQVLMQKIKTIKGSIEEKSILLQALNIENEYKILHSRYSASEDMEALKRAVFIQWYAASEPAIYTGIGSLDKEQEEATVRRLNFLISERKLDQEFEAMLLWYHSVNDWYFSGFQWANDLQRFLTTANGHIGIEHIHEMRDRGQMGDYWNSLRSK